VQFAQIDFHNAILTHTHMHTTHMIILFQLFLSLFEKGSGKVHGRGRTQSRKVE